MFILICLAVHMSAETPKVKTHPSQIRHAPTITAYDRENFATYLVVHDALNDGVPKGEIVNYIWGALGPVDVNSIIQEHLKRAQWFISTGYLQLHAEDPLPRDERLDSLVDAGAMSAAERAFLDSPEGEKFWPRPKH